MKFMESCLEHAKEIILKEGELLPRFITNDSEGKGMYIVTPWRDEKDKEAILSFVSLKFIAEGIQEYCLLSEVWMKNYKDPKLHDPSKSLEHEPDRQEGLSVIHVWRDKDKLHKELQMYAMVRDEAGKLIKLEPRDKMEDIQGRMTDLLNNKVLSLSEIKKLKEALAKVEKHPGSPMIERF
jgi:hypothetical protein